MRIPVLLAAALGLLAPTAAPQGTVTPYGCGVNPAGSLLHLGGPPVPGGTMIIGVEDPLALKQPGSIAVLQLSAIADPSYPCGTPIPGLGLGGAQGEVLLSLAAPLIPVGVAMWGGPMSPASFEVGLPNAPGLQGKHVFLQGAMVDVGGPTGIGLTEGLDVHIGTAMGDADLKVRSVWVQPIPVAPGEPVEVHAIVENTGTGGSTFTDVEIALSSGPQGVVPLPPVPPGGQREVMMVFPTNPGWMQQNPHWPTVTVDPQDGVEELDEQNNTGGATKPGFVVNVQYVPPAPIPEHDDVIEIQDGVAISYTSTVYAPGQAKSDNFQFNDPQKGQPHPETGQVEPLESGVPPQPRVDPDVLAADQAAQPGEMLTYIVKYDHGVEMPQLPHLLDNSGRFAEANIPALEVRLGRLEATRRLRAQAAAGMVDELVQAGGKVLETYALAGAMMVEAPKGHLDLFDQNPMVQHVEGIHLGELTGDVNDARDQLQTDPYFSGGATGAGFIAVIDSGVRQTHDLLTSSDHIWFVEDCVDGDASCNDTGSSSYDTDDDRDHGTSVTAIITGNTNHGNDYRGFTSSWVDSWRVTRDSDHAIPSSAVLRAFDQAVAWGDQLINCSFGFQSGSSGTVAQAADDAYASGSAVFCANGNDGGGSGTVDSPAVAHKVLGVGAYDIDTLVDESYQSDGPTSDNRHKPDLQAPTNMDTADASSDTLINGFSGTSGATPCVTGAASVFADWFGITSMTTANAGKIYASLINGGRREFGSFNSTKGVGKFELPLNGRLYYGSRNVGRYDNDYVTINVPSGTTKISCAIWWAESDSASHRDIDLYLEKPDGSTSDYSISVPSVFEHLEVSGIILTGNRDVRIYGYDVPSGTTKTTYYAIHVEY